MSPVAFDGHRVYQAIFIVTYTVWLSFELFASRSRKSSDSTKARDRGSFRFLVSIVWRKRSSLQPEANHTKIII